MGQTIVQLAGEFVDGQTIVPLTWRIRRRTDIRKLVDVTLASPAAAWYNKILLANHTHKSKQRERCNNWTP